MAKESGQGRVARFAPSPTGHLHAGHLFSALLVWEWRRRTGGRVLLRMEDHDRQRSKPEFEASILEDLEWLALRPDPAPDGRAFIRQSDRDRRYREVLEELAASGLVYACDCSRKILAARTGPPARGTEPRYDGFCAERGLPLSAEDVSLRLRLPPRAVEFCDGKLGPQRQAPFRQCGDMVLRERNGNFTYQFCVTIDDFDQGITDVVRGADVLASTGRQILLGELLGRPAPPRYWHHELLREPSGRKLSKRFFSESISSWRAEGLSAEAARERLRRQAGAPPDWIETWFDG